MTTSFLTPDLERDEAYAKALPNGDCEAYPDPDSQFAIALRAGWKTEGLSGEPWTIAFGHTGREVHPGLVWTRTQGLLMLAVDIKAVCLGLDTAMPWWRTLDDIRQDCVANQAFNLGVHGLLKFPTYTGLLKAHEYAAAAKDDLHTLWAKQVGNRAVRICRQLASGIHQSLPA